MTTQNVKKAYIDIVELLEANSNKKVSTILPQILEMVTSKSTSGVGKTFKTDDEGNVTHIFCYYHKQWEAIDVAEYGKKKHSASGFNTMCKEGVSHWTKANRMATIAKESVLAQVASGELSGEDVAHELALIEEAKGEITPRADGHFVTFE